GGIRFGAENGIGRERHFRYVELAVIEHAPEGLARAQREECQVYALGPYPSVDQRLGAIVTATGEGQLELMHGARTRRGTFSCRDHLPGIGTTCAVRWRRPLPFSAVAVTPGHRPATSDPDGEGRPSCGAAPHTALW